MCKQIQKLMGGRQPGVYVFFNKNMQHIPHPQNKKNKNEYKSRFQFCPLIG